MAATIPVEEERGTYVSTPHPHPHNGYYAGDFSNVPIQVLPIELSRAA